MYENILDQLEDLVKQEIKNFGADFSKNERVVWTTMFSWAPQTHFSRLGNPIRT